MLMKVILKGNDIKHRFTLSILAQGDDKAAFFITSPLLGNDVEIKFTTEGPSFDESFRFLKEFSKSKTIENLKKHVLSMRRDGNLSQRQAKFCYAFVIRMIAAKDYSSKDDYIKNGLEEIQQLIPDLDQEYPELSKSDINAIECTFASGRTGFEYSKEVSCFRSKYWDDICETINNEMIGVVAMTAFA